MEAPKVIIDAAERYVDNLNAELREIQFSRDMAQRDVEQSTARVNKCDSAIKQIQADLEEIRKWLAAQKGEKQDAHGGK